MNVPSSVGTVLGISYAVMYGLIQSYGYIGIIILMTLEGAALPIPSEVIIPLAGYFAAKGALNIYLAFIAVLVGNAIGILIDYYIGYFIGKKVVYKHLQFFHIKKKSLDAFDAWFERNGVFAVFISRMLPEVRGLISFPAGFAKMPLKKFLFWSILGSAIWDAVLILFGYYLISTGSITVIIGSVAVFVIILYLILRYAMKRIHHGSKTSARR